MAPNAAPGADLWQGPRRLFEAAGFTVAATRQANAAARPHLIMRRELPDRFLSSAFAASGDV